MKLFRTLGLIALLAGCGSINHDLYPDSPVTDWEKVNKLTRSYDARLTLVTGHQLLVNDVELRPDTSSFIGTDSDHRLLIATDQIRGALVLKRGQHAARYGLQGLLFWGAIGALIGYGGASDPESGGFVPPEGAAAIGGIFGAIGGLIGFSKGMGRDSIAVHYNAEVSVLEPFLESPNAGNPPES